MDRKTQLQFRLLTQDAQRSAVRRLALRGLDDEEIAQATGWSEAEVRRVLEPPVVADFMAAVFQRTRRSGSSGNPVHCQLASRTGRGMNSPKALHLPRPFLQPLRTSMRRGRSSGRFGMRTVSTPSLRFASILLASNSLLSMKLLR